MRQLLVLLAACGSEPRPEDAGPARAHGSRRCRLLRADVSALPDAARPPDNTLLAVRCRTIQWPVHFEPDDTGFIRM